MSSNKKKGSKKQASSGKKQASSATPLSNSDRNKLPLCLRECRHQNPGACSECMWTYWPGCMHTLSEEERLSDGMNARLELFVRIFDDSARGLDVSDFWEREEHQNLLDTAMLRMLVYTIIRWMLMTERSQNTNTHARDGKRAYIQSFFKELMSLYGVQQLGSVANLNAVLNFAPGQGKSLEPSHLKVGCLIHATSMYVHPGPGHRGYYGIMHLMDKMTPCSCLKVHLKRLKPSVDHEATFECSGCGEPETASKALKECSRCKLAQYCSVDCQRADWKNGKFMPHKIGCKDLCEFFALFKPPSSATETETK
jgi:hypothetical protein